MKKKSSIFLLLNMIIFLFLTVFAYGQSQYNYTINYYRYAEDYEDKNMWVWEIDKDGQDQEFNIGLKDGFMRAEFSKDTNKIGFLMKDKSWGKDIGDNRFIEIPANQNNTEVWIVQGDKRVYTNKNDIDLSPRINTAFMDSEKEILVTLNSKIKDTPEYGFYLKQSDKNIDVKASKVDDFTIKLTVTGNDKIDVTKIYEVGSTEYKPVNVVMRCILDSDTYYYDGNDLGVNYTKEKSTFKVWAPTAEKTELLIYDNAGIYNDSGYVTDNTNGKAYDMTSSSNGVWTAECNEDLKNKFYMYRLSFVDGTVNYAVDPYAKAVSANGQRSVVVDLNETDPDNWNKGSFINIKNPTDSIIYELHVKDFSTDKDINFKYSGKFKAFTEDGLKTPDGEMAGIDHLSDLGVNYVHILPSYDFRTVNELTVDNNENQNPKFNWGYDPQNYNVPEGSYSTDPNSPTVRITEFKEMVQSLHQKDIGLIMDVVYNHTASIEDGPFDKIVPGYFYRTDNKGNYSNGSGCGNEVASERPMVRKYIKDSVKYWVNEYNVDGFRFDLMGLIDTDTMEQITKELKQEFNKNILIYGEPWQAGGSVLPENLQTLKGSQKNKEFSVFNDNIRMAIKGDSDGSGKGFATGFTENENDIKEGVVGSINTIAASPSESINYVTAHDNLNLWDKIIKTQGLEKEEGFIDISDGKMKDGSSVEYAISMATPYSNVDLKNVLDNETVKRSLLSNGIIFTSQGIPFIQAGDEILRTKYGDGNSYKSPDVLNQIKWENKYKFKPVYDYYKGLIALRKNHTAFRMTTKEDINRNIDFLQVEQGMVAFNIKDNANGDLWKNITVIYNGNTENKSVTLPFTGDWNIVVDDSKAGIDIIKTLKDTNKVDINGISIMVLYNN